MRNVRVGRVAGIPIGIQPLWIAVLGLITFSLGAVYFPDAVPGIAPAAAYALGLASALLLFASILLHELGHALVARRDGIEIEEIDLWLLGGVARMSGYPQTPAAELRFALAGPAVTLAIAAGFGTAALAMPDSAPAAVRALADYQAVVNLAILGFNLLPAFPLDGGRVVQALVWWRTGDLARATSLAARVGSGFGFAMIAAGLGGLAYGYAGGIWLGLVGFFVIAAARAEERGTRVRLALSGRRAGPLATFPAVTLPASLSVAGALDEYLSHRHTAYPVLEGDRALGIVDLSALLHVPAERRRQTPVGDVAIRDPRLIVTARDDVGRLLESAAFGRVGRAVVVREDGVVGLISVSDIETVARALDAVAA